MLDAVSTTQRTFSPGGALTSETILFADGATVRRRFECNRRGQRTYAADSAFVTAGAFWRRPGRIHQAGLLVGSP